MDSIFRLMHRCFVIKDVKRINKTYYITTDDGKTYYCDNPDLGQELEEILDKYIGKGYAVWIKLTSKNGRVYFTIPDEEEIDEQIEEEIDEEIEEMEEKEDIENLKVTNND